MQKRRWERGDEARVEVGTGCEVGGPDHRFAVTARGRSWAGPVGASWWTGSAGDVQGGHRGGSGAREGRARGAGFASDEGGCEATRGGGRWDARQCWRKRVWQSRVRLTLLDGPEGRRGRRKEGRRPPLRRPRAQRARSPRPSPARSRFPPFWWILLLLGLHQRLSTELSRC